MNWEDWPPLQTQPYGVQSDGAVVQLWPPGLPSPPITSPTDISGQLAVVQAATPTAIAMGAGEPVTDGEILSHEGYVVFVDTATTLASLILSDGTTTAAPADGDAYPLTLS